jgi:hypothetical protein
MVRIQRARTRVDYPWSGHRRALAGSARAVQILSLRLLGGVPGDMKRAALIALAIAVRGRVVEVLTVALPLGLAIAVLASNAASLGGGLVVSALAAVATMANVGALRR